MPFDMPLRAWLALIVVALSALIVGVHSGMAVSAVVVALFGGVAVLVALSDDTGPAETPAPEITDTIDVAALLDAIVEPVILLRRARVVQANRAARALLGDHIVGEDVRTAIRHPAAAERLVADIDADTMAQPIELVGLGTLDQRWQMRVGRLADGAKVVHLIDQTGSSATERMRVDFVANASHELRTPLASILGYVETLSDAAGEDPETRVRFLKIVLDEAQRMQRLVEDLMSLSRIEAEKYRLPASEVDLAALIEEVRSEVADGHGARDREIVIAAEPGLPTVAGDRSQLSQMLHNLVGNALKYGAAGTPVTISIAREGERMLKLIVADRGDGIGPDHLPRLTERFYRADPGRSRALGGTGLGLAIVKHIVERHRGRLEIASTLGAGTTISVTLPMMTAAPRPLS